MLIEAFSDEEITALCFDDFREVYDQFGTGLSKTAKVHRLIEYCSRRLEIDWLLNLVRACNPSQYGRYAARLRSAGRDTAQDGLLKRSGI
jgi:hypothetical protein